jgi:hypothetical protein
MKTKNLKVGASVLLVLGITLCIVPRGLAQTRPDIEIVPNLADVAAAWSFRT